RRKILPCATLSHLPTPVNPLFERPANLFLDPKRLLFERAHRIAHRQTLSQVALQKRTESAKTLVLRRVRQFVNQQPPLAPAIGSYENAISQCKSAGEGRKQAGHLRGCAQNWV